MKKPQKFTKKPAPERVLTPADLAAARRLSALWDAAVTRRKSTANPLTQQVMADRLAAYTGKGTQGAISQYVNGGIALNYKAVLAFAEELECAPEAIRDDLPEQRAERHQAADTRSPGLVRSQTDNDIVALQLAVAALFSLIASERPGEGARLAATMKAELPPAFASNGLAKRLIAALEKGARRSKKRPPTSSASDP